MFFFALVNLLVLHVAVTSSADPNTLCTNEALVSTYSCNMSAFLTMMPASGRAIVDDLNCGIKVDKHEFDTPPVVTYFQADENSTYTLMMMDRDAMGLSKGEYYIYLLLSNIPGGELAEGKTSSGKEVTSFEIPEPEEGTGEHRFMCVLFQETSVNLDMGVEVDRKFNLGNWLNEKSGKLCGPIAAVQWTTSF